MNSTLVASFDETQGGQLGDQFRVDRRLGGEVEVGQGEGGGQRREAGQAGPAAGVDGGDLDGEEPFQERLVAEFGRGGVVQFAGQGLGGCGHAQEGQMARRASGSRRCRSRPALAA